MKSTKIKHLAKKVEKVMKLSFSTQVKNELSRIIPEPYEFKIAELSALIRMSGSLKLLGFNRLAFRVNTDNPAIARKVFVLLKSCFGINVQIQVKKNNNLKKNNTYSIYVSEQEAHQVLQAAGIIEKHGDGLRIKSDIPKNLVSEEEAQRAYIRGAFLGGGSVSDPEKTYHMEFVTFDEQHSRYLRRLLNHYSFNAKIVMRKNAHVIYMKESDHISDALNIMGAHTALLKMEDVKIMKQVRNTVNRIVNCETANLSKTVYASSRQIESIQYIQETVGLDYLTENLKEIAQLRLQYEDASLKELGELLSRPLGKSGVNHRLKKIEDLANELREGRISNDF